MISHAANRCARRPLLQRSSCRTSGTGTLQPVVAAVHYFGTEADQFALLDYLDEPDSASLHPWPVLTNPAVSLSRKQALVQGQVTIASTSLGPPVLVRPGGRAMEVRGRSGLFNQMNWERMRPVPGERLIDSNASPILFWTPGASTPNSIKESSIGSQADSMAAISKDYARWVSRTMNWVRRNGTKVWGTETTKIRPDLDIQLSTISTVYALPAALAAMEAGACGHGF